jgi:hypothetical protein
MLRTLLTRVFPVYQTKDSYLPYNKPMSIIHWLQNAQPQADVIIIMDPDCLMFKPIDIVRWPLSATIRVWLTPLQVVEQGRPIAQKAFFDFHRAASDGDRTCAAPWHEHNRPLARAHAKCCSSDAIRRYMDIFNRYCSGCTFVDPIAVPVIIHRYVPSVAIPSDAALRARCMPIPSFQERPRAHRSPLAI